MMRHEVDTWTRFHRWWLKQRIPHIVVRFEDLRTHPALTMRSLLTWIEFPHYTGLLRVRKDDSPATAPPGPESPPAPAPVPREEAAATTPREGAMERDVGGGREEPWALPPGAPRLPAALEAVLEEIQGSVPQLASPLPSPPAQDQVHQVQAKQRGATQGLHPNHPHNSSSGSGGGVSGPGGAADGRSSAIARADANIMAGPYKPRSGKIGKALARLSQDLIDDMCDTAGPTLTSFGYHPTQNGFPERLRPPRRDRCIRQTLPPPMAAASSPNPNVPTARPTLRLNDPYGDKALRGPEDKFGRYMTTFRKMHAEDDTQPLPVVSGEPYRVPKRTFVPGRDG